MKMILKVLALPVLFVVTIACILGNLITNISSYVIALLLLIIAGCSIYCIIKALWTSLAILAGMGLHKQPVYSSAASGKTGISAWCRSKRASSKNDAYYGAEYRFLQGFAIAGTAFLI